jgi:hypothetical protein
MCKRVRERETLLKDGELQDEMSERVAETVRHALALVGPADSTTTERAGDTDQPFS